MARTQTMVQLTDELVHALSDEAHRRRISRSELIRQVLQAHLDAQAEASIGRRIAEGYERVPPTTPDEWGDLSEMTAQVAVDPNIHHLLGDRRVLVEVVHQPFVANGADNAFHFR